MSIQTPPDHEVLMDVPSAASSADGRQGREVDELLAALRSTTKQPRWPMAIGGLAAGIVGTLIATSVFGGGSAQVADVAVAELVAVDVVSTDMRWFVEFDGTLGFGDTIGVTAAASGTITQAAEVGATLRRGDVVARVDDIPVVLWYGPLPDWRDLDTSSTDGRDVLQVETNLRALGFDDDGAVTIDEDFTSATGSAIARWQESLGVEITSTYDDAAVVFAPGPVTVTAATASGNRVGTGSSLASLALQASVTDTVGDDGAVTSVSTSAQSVALEVTLADSGDFAVGKVVEIELADETIVAGRVTEIGTVAANRGNGTGIAVTIAIDGVVDSDLTEGPAVVRFLDRELIGITAVPVRALVVLAEGGYALEIVAEDGSTTLVAAEIGEILDGLAQITNDAVQPGQQIAAVR